MLLPFYDAAFCDNNKRETLPQLHKLLIQQVPNEILARRLLHIFEVPLVVCIEAASFEAMQKAHKHKHQLQ